MKEITDYTIIQRNSDGFAKVEISGKYIYDECSVIIKVMREDDNYTIVPWSLCDIDGENWKAVLNIPQGGLYRMEVRTIHDKFIPNSTDYDWGELIKCIYHVGVGDIFIMAGQSNMSGYGRDAAYDPPELGIHLYNNSGEWVLASHPLNSVANPVYCNNDSTSGTSPGLAFARTIRRQTGVPIGLVSAARGGSSLKSWNPAEEEPDLYEAMVKKIESVGGFTGMLWYQGCNETCEEAEADTYLEKFKQTVGLWREKFGFFPIVTCQINRHAWKEEPRDIMWGKVREAQRCAAMEIDGVYTVPTMDLFTVDGIHNSSSSCIVVGERMAAVMLKAHYALAGSFAPNIEKITQETDNTFILEFSGSNTLRTLDDNACGMDVDDAVGKNECVSISVFQNRATVTCARKIVQPAFFNAYWLREEPAFFVRDVYGMPMLACYGVKINGNEKGE